jgi:hypothetical protein
MKTTAVNILYRNPLKWITPIDRDPIIYINTP